MSCKNNKRFGQYNFFCKTIDKGMIRYQTAYLRGVLHLYTLLQNFLANLPATDFGNYCITAISGNDIKKAPHE